LNDSPEIRTAHNSFARPEPFVIDSSSSSGKKEDVFHFVAYVCVNNVVYELDGLQVAPIVLGELPLWPLLALRLCVSHPAWLPPNRPSTQWADLVLHCAR
jgi:hypothetical protein